jgi:hypothetical protein
LDDLPTKGAIIQEPGNAVKPSAGSGRERRDGWPALVGGNAGSARGRNDASRGGVLVVMAHAGGKTVLLVEDDEGTREAFVTLLAAEGYAVVGASDGLEAMARIRAGASPAVIVLDVMFPR